jgi:hypothetical protein
MTDEKPERTRKAIADSGLKVLLKLAEVQALTEHGGCFAIFFDSGRYRIVFGSKARRVWPADEEGYNQLRPALIAALAPQEDDDGL